MSRHTWPSRWSAAIASCAAFGTVRSANRFHPTNERAQYRRRFSSLRMKSWCVIGLKFRLYAPRGER